MKILILVFLAICSTTIWAKTKAPIKGSISVARIGKLRYAALAKISIQDAIAKAVAFSSGRVVEAALDREQGFLIYEVEVVSADRLRREILIDAGTGAILGEEKEE